MPKEVAVRLLAIRLSLLVRIGVLKRGLHSGRQSSTGEPTCYRNTCAQDCPVPDPTCPSMLPGTVPCGPNSYVDPKCIQQIREGYDQQRQQH